MANNPKKEKLPVWLIVVGFMIGVWPGIFLLIVRLIQNGELSVPEKQAASKPETGGSRTYNEQGQRTYQPPRPANQPAQTQARTADSEKNASGGMNADGTYRYNYTTPKTTPTGRPVGEKAEAKSRPVTPKDSGGLLGNKKLNLKRGKGLRLAGNIILGCGAFVTALVFLVMMAEGNWLANTMLVTSIVAMCCCTPGAVFSIIGSKKHNRVMRCRTYAAMIGSRRCVSMKELAAAIPVRYNKCVEDLQWMMSEGLLPGMYIDGTAKTLTYGDPAPEKEASAPKAAPEVVRTASGGEKIYPEEARIHRLNAQIQDAYVSQRMDRLEELTHKILAYAEEHPEKENSLRQFRNHHLPKTFSILESYARMERTGVAGGNISAAMKDVEAIMDKLVLGFEKQLDALFDSEALDVTTDISVLENMMNLEGLTDLDPFGSLKQDEELRKY